MKRIRLTGGEPLVHPKIVEIMHRIASIREIEEVSLTTYAMLLERLAHPFARAGQSRVNVSLDTLDPERFKRITREGDIDRVRRGLAAAERSHLTPLKLNTVIVRGLNDDELPALARLALNSGWHFHFIEVRPIGNAQACGEGFPAPEHRCVSVQTCVPGFPPFTSSLYRDPGSMVRHGGSYSGQPGNSWIYFPACGALL